MAAVASHAVVTASPADAAKATIAALPIAAVS
jgi:hypothetical protein